MKKAFPNYRKQGIINISLKPKDKTILNSFITDVSGSAGETKTNYIRASMLKIYDVSNVGFADWDYETLSKFLAVLNNSKMSGYYQNDFKKYLKRFLKFYYPDWSVRFKGFNSESIKQKKAINKEKKSKEKLISPEDFEKLIKGCDRFYFKALFSLAWDTSARPSELFKLKFSDIDLVNNKVKLTRYKTGNVSSIPLDPDGSIIHLQNHRENFIFPEVKKNDLIFPSPKDRSKPITTQGVHSYLNTLGKRTIDRNDLYMYLFRHTRLNALRKILSPDMYQMYADHSLEVGMQMYSHNDDEDLETEMFDRVFKTKKLTKTDKKEIADLKKELSETNKRIDKIMEAYVLKPKKKGEKWREIRDPPKSS